MALPGIIPSRVGTRRKKRKCEGMNRYVVILSNGNELWSATLDYARWALANAMDMDKTLTGKIYYLTEIL